jgi:hypothetical protein
MKNSIISLVMIALLFLLVNPASQAQNEAGKTVPVSIADSLSRLADQYFQLEKGVSDSLLAVSQALAQIESSLDSIQKRHEQVAGSLEDLEQARLSDLEAKYRKRVRKISLTPDFVKAANVSLSALCLSNSLTDYLNDVGQLSNPENEDLGVSLSTNISQVIDRQFFKGKDKVGGVKKSRFLQIVQHIVKSPLVSTLTSAVPVVSAIGSVTDLVSEMAVNNEEVKIEDFQAYQAEMAKYVAFYEALGKAGVEFNTSINNLGIRVDVLNNLLRNFTFERIAALDPEFLGKNGAEITLQEVLRNQFDRDGVLAILQEVEKTHPCDGQHTSGCESLLQDARLAYPDFAMNQARYIADELEIISNEYLKAFGEYQAAVEAVLAGAGSIVVAEMAAKKNQALRLKLQQLEKAFRSAVNTEDVRERFQRLSGGSGV